MRILITGGAGFIGSALCRYFQKSDEVFVIDNFSSGSRGFLSIDESRIHQGDILDTEFLMSVMKKVEPEWIVHLAAIHFIPFCNEFPFIASNINIVGTRNVLNAAALTGSVKKMFFASTAAVYGVSSLAHKESDAVSPVDIYGISKMTGEHLCNEFFLKTGIPTIVCRFFNAFGPNETNAHLIPAIESQIKSGSRHLKLGNLEPKRDFIHTWDMASAVALLLEKFEEGIDVFNLGQGIEYSVMDIIKAFELELGEKIAVESDPERVRKTERMNLLADIKKISSFTGWMPSIPINEGIRSLLNQPTVHF